MAYPGLWLLGPTGAGKSTIAYEIFVALHRTGLRSAYVDADQVGMCHPAPAHDIHNHELKARNVAAVWENSRKAGARCLIVSGGIRSQDEAVRYRRQLPDVALLFCRLSVNAESLRARLAMGSAGYGPPVPGREFWRTVAPESVPVAEAERAALEATTFADLVVDCNHLTPVQAAAEVRQRAGGWPVPG